MKCNRCGSEVMDGQITCPHCGNMMQSGVSMTHVGESGQTVTGTITSNGLGLNVAAAPIKNSKVAMIVSLVIAAVSLVVLGVGIFLAVRSGNGSEGGKTDVSENAGNAGNVGNAGSGGASTGGYHTLDCVQKGKTSKLEIALSFFDGELSVVEYDATIDTKNPDEMAMSVTFVMAAFEELKNTAGVNYSQITSGSQQLMSYRFELGQMSKTALSQLGDNFQGVTWDKVDTEMKELETSGFSCTKE